MYLKKSVGLIAVLVIAFLCANVGIGIECVEAAPNGSLWDDLFGPVIVSVEQSNDSPGQGEDVTITAHVTDIVGVSSVRLIYDTTEVVMTLDSGGKNNGYWNGTIPGQTACTTRTIYVTACNTAGNCVSSEPHEKQWRDGMPPEIVGVSQDPEEPCAGVPVDITAHVTDNVGVTSVTLTYDGTTVDMSLDSGSATDGNWTATIPGQTACTTLTITIVARDAEGNQDTDTHEKHWLDCAPPEIVEVSQDPEEPCAGVPVVITAHVTDNVGVTSVTLTYDGTTFDMSLDSGSVTDGNWTATMPGQTACTTLTITIVARDAEGNQDTDTHEKHWLDCAPPEIVAVSQDPEEPCVGEPEVITAHVTDNVGVTSVTLTYDGTTFDMSLNSGSVTDGNWTATIPGQTVGTTLTITIVARDAEGNQDTDTHEKHWRDCVPPEVTIISPEEGRTYETTSVDLIYTVNEPTRWAGYSLDGAENIMLIGNTTLDELPNGLHNLTIYAEDLAGNVGSNTVNFEVFAIAPTISNIKVTPTYALPGDSINISADIFIISP
jgi:ABC-type sulfate transport system substrate-binding protein